ncbi:MAG: helix-turn-helix transcriptional regulator [Candidatus Aureabacteria bacterium]|nr:helix-turn-helix transcriptional regulator [Candidatus Auribacterota bacterium]
MIRKPERVDISHERMEVSTQIRKIRKSTGLTQKDVAGRLGVIQQYISKIETGHENISIDTLKRIADVLDKKLIVRLR